MASYLKRTRFEARIYAAELIALLGQALSSDSKSQRYKKARMVPTSEALRTTGLEVT